MKKLMISMALMFGFANAALAGQEKNNDGLTAAVVAATVIIPTSIVGGVALKMYSEHQKMLQSAVQGTSVCANAMHLKAEALQASVKNVTVAGTLGSVIKTGVSGTLVLTALGLYLLYHL